MQASGKERVVICRAATICMDILDRPRETPDRDIGKTLKDLRSFVAELCYLQ